MSDCKRCAELETALRFYADAASKDPLWDSTRWDDGERAHAALSAPVQPATATKEDKPLCDACGHWQAQHDRSGCNERCGCQRMDTYWTKAAPPSPAAQCGRCNYMLTNDVVCTKCGWPVPSPAAPSKVKRNEDTPEAREFWRKADEAAAEVSAWPGWKRAGINAAQLRDEPRPDVSSPAAREADDDVACPQCGAWVSATHGHPPTDCGYSSNRNDDAAWAAHKALVQARATIKLAVECEDGIDGAQAEVTFRMITDALAALDAARERR